MRYELAIPVPLLLLCCAKSFGQEPTPDQGAPNQVVITAPRPGSVAPAVVLSAEDLQSYPVEGLDALLDLLRPLTRSGRSDKDPILLVNGRLAGQVELQNYPPEAIERVEILPEATALRFGGGEDRRVVNFVLRRNFRGIPSNLKSGVATEGGAESVATDASLLRLSNDSQATLRGSYSENTWLRDNERDVNAPDAQDQTLLPAKEEEKLAGTVAGSIFDVSWLLEGSLDGSSNDALQGLAEASPAGLSNVLRQTMSTNTAHLATHLTGLWRGFVWTAGGGFDRSSATSYTDIGLDTFGALLMQRTTGTLNAGMLDFSISGPVARLPTGDVIANMSASASNQVFTTQAAASGVASTQSTLRRKVGSLKFNVVVPITNHADTSSRFGDLALDANVDFESVSAFRLLTTFGGGVSWDPTTVAHLSVAFEDTELAPTVQQLQGPTVVTPNVEMFDLVTGETVYVTELTGGEGALQPSSDRTTSLALRVGPFLGAANLTARYERHRVQNAIGQLPPVTAALEAGFPDRFVRDSSGTLTEFDDRWINFAEKDKDDLEWGGNYSASLDRAHLIGRRGLQFSIFVVDTWYFRDAILVRQGVLPLDLLNGAPTDSTDELGGQPRHKTTLTTGLFERDRGWGTLLQVKYRSPTDVGDGGAAAGSALHFSALVTADVKVFADLGRTFKDVEWAKDSRITLGVINVFDQRQTVLDAIGATPLGFQPGYLDPMGRLVTLQFHKLFR